MVRFQPGPKAKPLLGPAVGLRTQSLAGEGQDGGSEGLAQQMGWGEQGVQRVSPLRGTEKGR